MDEHQILEKIRDLVDVEKCNSLPFGDDAVAIPLGDKFQVINIDGWVASTDRPPGLSAFGCGYRAVINAISDVIVKGAQPQNMLISLSIPDMKEVEELVRGFSEAARDYAINYLGGDLNQAKDLVIDVSVFGMADQLISRYGASDGDYLYWLGPELGQTAAALGILVNNWQGDKNRALQIMGNPRLYPEFIDLIKKHKISSSIDCSDGLIKSIYQVLGGKLGVDLDDYNDWIIDDWARGVADVNGQALKDLAFYGGEELGILFTCDQSIVGENIQLLGQISKGQHVKMNGEVIKNKGWEHFSDRE